MTTGDQKTFKNISGASFDNFRELELQVLTNMTSGEGLIEITNITTFYNELEIPA